MTAVRVSVIIPTFNSAAFVTEAVDSVLAQTVPAEQIIVVDDGSTDNTRQALAKYGDRIRYVYQQNAGVAAARNRGIQESTGDLIAFLDADDVWHPRKLELQLAALDAHPELGLLGASTFDWPGEVPHVDGRVADPIVVPWEKLAVRNYFTTSTIVIRRTMLDRVGPFDVTLHGPEDYDLWLRIADVSPVAYLPARLTGYRDVAGSLGKRAERMQADVLRIYGKIDARNGWRGRRLLRRKAHSYSLYAAAYLHGAAGNQWRGIRTLLRSFLWYPLPYRRSEVRMRFARPRLLCMLMLRMLRLAARAPEARPAIVASGPTAIPSAAITTS